MSRINRKDVKKGALAMLYTLGVVFLIHTCFNRFLFSLMVGAINEKLGESIKDDKGALFFVIPVAIFLTVYLLVAFLATIFEHYLINVILMIITIVITLSSGVILYFSPTNFLLWMPTVFASILSGSYVWDLRAIRK